MLRFFDTCNGKCYIIPENQRGYSWLPQNVESVFSDLELSESQNHYMGPIIVTRTERDDFQTDNFNTVAEFTLEDGQQRLTTFFLIVSEIKRRIEEINGMPDIESQELGKLLFYPKGGDILRIRNSNSELNQYLSFKLTGFPAPPSQKTPPMMAL